MFQKVFHIITYLFLFLLCVFLADFYQHPLFLFLTVLLLFLPPLSYVSCRYAFSHLRCEIVCPAYYATSGDCVTLSIRLQQDSIFPLPECQIQYQITSTFYPCDKQRLVICPSYAKDTYSFDLPLTMHRAGCYQISLKSLSTFDYLHFFTFTRSLTERKDLVIYPKKTVQFTFDKNSYGEGFDEYEETQAKGNISSNVTDVREYIPGDRLQKIHWKLSAKIDKLMVKENEQTASHQFTLLTELYQPVPESDCLEQALANAFSVADAFLSAGEPFFFIFYSLPKQDFSRFFICCKEELEQAFLECFYQPSYQVEDLALTTLQNASMQSGILLHATHKGVSDVLS